MRHDPEQLPPLVPLDGGEGDGRFVRVRGVLSVPRGGGARLCPLEAVSAIFEADPMATMRCPDDAPRALSSFLPRLSFGDLEGFADGTFMARQLANGRFAEVAGPMGGAHVPGRGGRPGPYWAVSDLVEAVQRQGMHTALVFRDPVASPHPPSGPVLPAKAVWRVRPGAQVFQYGDNPAALTFEQLAEKLAPEGPLQMTVHIDRNHEVTFVAFED